jgi:hypothetical protein
LNVPPAGGDTVIGDDAPVAPVEAPLLSSTAVTTYDEIAPSPVSEGAVKATDAEPMLVEIEVIVGASGVLSSVKALSVPPGVRAMSAPYGHESSS